MYRNQFKFRDDYLVRGTSILIKSMCAKRRFYQPTYLCLLVRIITGRMNKLCVLAIHISQSEVSDQTAHWALIGAHVNCKYCFGPTQQNKLISATIHVSLGIQIPHIL